VPFWNPVAVGASLEVLSPKKKKEKKKKYAPP
jgi:hypothetical protein